MAGCACSKCGKFLDGINENECDCRKPLGSRPFKDDENWRIAFKEIDGEIWYPAAKLHHEIAEYKKEIKILWNESHEANGELFVENLNMRTEIAALKQELEESEKYMKHLKASCQLGSCICGLDDWFTRQNQGQQKEGN